jgi:hypothetical protein
MIVNLKSLVAVLASFLMCGCGSVARSQLNASNPRIIPSKEIPRIVSAIPSYAGFSYSGLVFFDGKLYASSNIGLLEYEGGTLSRLYKWYDRDDVISGPWLDRANRSLWVFHDGINKLIRFDGKSWSATDLPRPKEGYTRGDLLRGFRGFSTDAAFWLQGGNHAWRWDAGKAAWVSEPTPDIGLFVSIAPIRDKVFVIMRHEYVPYIAESPFNRSEKPNSDAVYFLQDGRWQELPNKSGVKFFAEDIVIGPEAAYILTRDSKLLRLTPSEIAPIESLGDVEAMAAASSGNLLVSSSNNGVHEYSNGWRKKFPPPYPPSEAEHWTYLAENSGQVAIAITSLTQTAGENKRKYPGQTTLWLSNGSGWKAVPLGER